MYFSTCPVVGTIALHGCGQRLADDADDSSLESILTSLVRGTLAAGDDGQRRGCYVPTNRLSRFGLGSQTATVQADFDRLAGELAEEYERVVMA